MFNFKSLLPIALLTVNGVASMNVSANETALDAQQVAQLIEKADS
ncbi:outer membrane lipoprotein-sorting protein, partial [Vibrio parahaemolyticus]|nr:outer membrane lipoprotein-sorting protein [Vibrio parahaemolyticus]NMS64911.1 outer membrane lipoprotein-sorting protein [Vibrio parahaemolyticus]